LHHLNPSHIVLTLYVVQQLEHLQSLECKNVLLVLVLLPLSLPMVVSIKVAPSLNCLRSINDDDAVVTISKINFWWLFCSFISFKVLFFIKIKNLCDNFRWETIYWTF